MTKALAVIFDMDGLMLDTEPISLRVWTQAAHDLGYTLDEETSERMIGLNHAASREMLLQCFGSACPVDELFKSAQARYREALDLEGVPLKQGLLELIQFLDEQSIPRAVATSTATALAARNLRQAGILHHFAIIVGGDAVGRGKPEPDIFLEAAFRLNQRPADCVVLEDSGPGIQAAAAAGMRPILIPDRGREPSAETRRAAYAVVESLSAAKDVIAGMLEG
jgi:HAD superfamily hydrolase (TIGR01509 family)